MGTLAASMGVCWSFPKAQGHSTRRHAAVSIWAEAQPWVLQVDETHHLTLFFPVRKPRTDQSLFLGLRRSVRSVSLPSRNTARGPRPLSAACSGPVTSETGRPPSRWSRGRSLGQRELRHCAATPTGVGIPLQPPNGSTHYASCPTSWGLSFLVCKVGIMRPPSRCQA